MTNEFRLRGLSAAPVRNSGTLDEIAKEYRMLGTDLV